MSGLCKLSVAMYSHAFRRLVCLFVHFPHFPQTFLRCTVREFMVWWADLCRLNCSLILCLFVYIFHPVTRAIEVGHWSVVFFHFCCILISVEVLSLASFYCLECHDVDVMNLILFVWSLWCLSLSSRAEYYFTCLHVFWVSHNTIIIHCVICMICCLLGSSSLNRKRMERKMVA